MKFGKLNVLACGVILAGLALSGSGCSSNKDKDDRAACRAAKPGTITTVNKVCPVMNDDPVDPAVTPVAWKGQSIGFCCKGCMPKWNAMTDAQKDAAVKKAIEMSKS